MKLFFEKIFPYVIGAIVGLLAWLSGLRLPSSEDLLGATLSVAGILVGFLSTSKAILMSMTSPIIEQLRRSKYINELVSYIGEAIWANLAFCVVNIVGYFVVHVSHGYTITWVASGAIAAFAFVRVTHIMLRIFRYS